MSIKRILLVLPLALAALAPLSRGTTFAATLNVCPSGCTYTTIASAINAAQSGDTIDIGAGTYPENLDLTKSVSLIGSGSVTVDGSNGSVVQVPFSNTTVTLDGLTLSGGNASQNGGGGILNAGTVQVNNSTISGNSDTDGYGGGIDNVGILSVSNSTISGNSVPSLSGAGGGRNLQRRHADRDQQHH